MGYGWESLEANNTYIGIGQYIDGLMSDCGMDNHRACSWLKKILTPFQRIQCVNLYQQPINFCAFDDFDVLGDIEHQDALVALRDCAHREIAHSLDDLYLSKSEVIRHSKRISTESGNSPDAAPIPTCLSVSSQVSKTNKGGDVVRVSLALKVLSIVSYEEKHGTITNYKRTADIMTSTAGTLGYPFNFDEETLKRWVSSVRDLSVKKIA